VTKAEAHLGRVTGRRATRPRCTSARACGSTNSLSFVAAAAATEAHDNSASRAFRLHPPRQQRIARRQELEIVEADATQACRARIFHHQQITGAAAPVAGPFALQWLDHHQIRGTACLLG
jgi:hypothetical protein